MTVSRFISSAMVKVAPPKEKMLRKSNFAGGIDTLTSLEELGINVSPYARNVRNVHQGSIGIKKGPGFYSYPSGQLSSTNHTSSLGLGDTTITTTSWVASLFQAASTNRLTRLDIRIKSINGTAPLIIEIWSDASGPASKIASSSISSSSITTNYAYLSCFFIEAPLLTTGTNYWIVCYQQQNGTGSYACSSSTTYTGGLTSSNSGTAWISSPGLNFINFVSTDGGTLGSTRVAFSNGSKYDIIAVREAAGTTGVYWINPATGILTIIKSGLSGSATNYIFAFTNDLLVYTNEFDNPRQWDGSVDNTVVFPSTLISSPIMSVINHKNRWFFLEKNTSRVVFSEVGDITTYFSSNFIYLPAPKTGDPANCMFRLQDNLWFGTRKTKYVLYGSDLSSFVLRQSTATKGVINQNSVTIDGNFAYFASDDGIYSCNGATDQLLSRFVTPTYQAIPDLTKSTIIVWNNTLRYYFAEAGSPVNSAMLSLDLVNGGWFYDTNAYVSRVFRYQTKGDPLSLIECSSLVGQAMMAEQQYSDMGKPIKMEYFDAPQCMGDPAVFKQILFYYVRFVAEAGSYLVNCQMDKELQNSPADGFVQMQGGGAQWGTATWGSFVWGQSNFIEKTIPVSGEYRWWQPRFTITGADIPVEFTGYTMYYLEQAPR